MSTKKKKRFLFVLMIACLLCSFRTVTPLHAQTDAKSDKNETPSPSAEPEQEVTGVYKEIEELYKKKSYSIVLEKVLAILTTEGDRLPPKEAAFLHYYAGLAYKQNNNMEMAADYFKKVEHKFPVSTYLKYAYMELSELSSADYFKQESYLEKVFNNYPRTPEALEAGLRLSRDYLRLKNFKKALPVLETLVNLWKKSAEKPELNMLLAVAYSGIKDYIEALVYLRIAEKEIKSVIFANPAYLLEAGRIFFNNINFANAVTYLESLINIFPKYEGVPEAATLLAQAYEKENKNFMAVVFLIKALDRKPAQKQLHTLFLNLGRVLGKLTKKEHDVITQNYPLYADTNKALTIVKNNSSDFNERRQAAILLSGELKKSDNMGQAIDNYRSFLESKRDPVVEKMFKKDLDIYLRDLDKRQEVEKLFQFWIALKRRKSYLSGENLLLFGELLYKMRMYANAAEVYNHLLKFKMYGSLWKPSRQQLARIEFKMGRYERCLDNISYLDFPSEPERSEFNYYKAASYQNLKQAEPLNRLLETVDIKKVFTEHQYQLVRFKARYLEEQKKYTDALAYYQKNLQYSGAERKDEGNLMVALADLYYNVDDPESALSYYRLAQQYEINQEWVLYRIAHLLKGLGKEDDAKEALEQLKTLNPDSFWTQQLQKEFN